MNVLLEYMDLSLQALAKKCVCLCVCVCVCGGGGGGGGGRGFVCMAPSSPISIAYVIGTACMHTCTVYFTFVVAHMQ